MSAPGSSVQKSLSAHGSIRVGEMELAATRALAVCEIAVQVFTVEESARTAAAMQEPSLRIVAEAACHLIERLCVIGSRGATGVTSLGEKWDADVASALKGLAQALYTRFQPIRAAMRRRLAMSLSDAVSMCMHVPRAQLGVRLHALDGGARPSSITLVGASQGLEVLL